MRFAKLYYEFKKKMIDIPFIQEVHDSYMEILTDDTIDRLLTIDDTGMPKAPNIKQLLDKDVKALYLRDNTPDKIMYIKEVGVIYYLADPKGPCMQEGLSRQEALKEQLETWFTC